MSLAACDERCASVRTSDATTAKPRPASPARAASTAALSAKQIGLPRDLVDDADDVGNLARRRFDLRHRRDRLGDHLAAVVGNVARLGGRLVGCCAFSAFFFTVAAISSIEAEVSSRLAACSSVRCDKSVVLLEISAAALVTSRADILISPMVWPTRSAAVLALFFSVGEVALIVRGDAFGQIALGRARRACRRDRAAPCAILSQSVLISGADIKHQAGLAVERDPLGEVAGGRGLDDVADGRLEFVGHLGHGGLALGFGALVLFGFRGGFALRILGRFHLEGLDGSGDVADLVLAGRPGSTTAKLPSASSLMLLVRAVIGFETDRAVKKAIKPPISRVNAPMISGL